LTGSGSNESYERCNEAHEAQDTTTMQKAKGELRLVVGARFIQRLCYLLYAVNLKFPTSQMLWEFVFSHTRPTGIGPSPVRNWLRESADPIKLQGRTTMSDLIVTAFPTEAKAEEVRQKLLAMQKEYLIELGDAVIAVKDADGNIKLNQLFNTTAAGAVSGTFWGALIGLIFLMPLAGAALGAASGAIGGALTDVGIDDKWIKETAAAIQPGTAALFVLVRKVTADKVLERLKGEGGTVMKTSLDHTKEAALQAALAGLQAAVPASGS
jgi:uncharacterized membrane protein